MTSLAQDRAASSAVVPRILVAGTDLLAGALASALERHGFATMHIAPKKADIERGIEWLPDLVLFDIWSFDIDAGATSLRQFCGNGLQVCVIDAVDDGDRRAEWTRMGASELIDRGEPFDQLFRTITRLLRINPSARSERRSPASLAAMRAGAFDQNPQLERFATLTDREQFVLAELLEGHCAEEIAKTAFVSISTVRSQIKSILQKLGVNSQLAAVALARRAGWSLNRRRHTDPKPTNARRSRAS